MPAGSPRVFILTLLSWGRSSSCTNVSLTLKKKRVFKTVWKTDLSCLRQIIKLYERYERGVLSRLGGFTFRVVVAAYIKCDPRRALELIKR